MVCPFCDQPHKTEWFFNGDDYVIAVCPVAINPKENAEERDDCIILFPHNHITQRQLLMWKYSQFNIEQLLVGIARIIWGKNVKYRIDWVPRHYPNHGHVQLYKVK